MFTRRKLFFYSDDTVSYNEARGYRLRFAGKVIASTVIGLVALAIINQMNGDFLGLTLLTDRSLVVENSMLKSEIKTLNSKLSNFSEALSTLASSDNELRTAVNLPKIDNQTRLMGIGGTKVENYDGIFSKESGDLLTSASTLLQKLDREIAFQKESYKDIYKQSEENKIRFACLPAIKPMSGSFSYHGFGMRTDPILGTLRSHEGVDIHGDVGTPVYATGDGVVEFSGNTGSGYGTALEINHGFGYKTWYAHLSRTVAKSGQKVKRGALIAYSGNSGRSTGPHLHYEVRYNGEKENPVEYFVSDVDYDKIRAQLKENSYLVKK